jgi:hypothetical protein
MKGGKEEGGRGDESVGEQLCEMQIKNCADL